VTTIFVTSDWHWFHPLVATQHRGYRLPDGSLKLFESVEEHNEILIERFNKRVTKRDKVVFLGDSNAGKERDALELIATRLNGLSKHIVFGNHDSGHPMHEKSQVNQRRFVGAFDSVASIGRLKIAGQRVMTSHFPFLVDHTYRPRYNMWRPRPEPQDDGLPQWLLHGHTHLNVRRTGIREIHVGVDAWDLYPVAIDEIAALMKETYDPDS